MKTMRIDTGKTRRITVALTLLGMLTLSALLTATPAAAQTTAKVWTDKADYSSGETVTISGSGFLASATIHLQVTRPDASVDSWNATSDASVNKKEVHDLLLFGDESPRQHHPGSIQACPILS